MSVAHDKIEELAYRLWLDDGAPEGRAMDYWLQAEAALHATTVNPVAAKATKAKAPAKPKAAAKPKAEKPPAKPKAEKPPAKPKAAKA